MINISATAQEADPACKAGHPRRMLLVLSVLLGFASISTDFYLPALPIMRASLHATQGMMALTISGYLVGFSFGQLFWGPISDRYGRRPPITAGLALFTLGSLGCALSESAPTIVAWRIVQALGACASVVLGRAMIRDLYSGTRAAQMLSTLMLVMAIAPLIGPIVGAQIMILLGWRAIFWTLVVLGVATLVAVQTLPETHAPGRRIAEPLPQVLATYGRMLRQPGLLAFAGSCGFFFGGTFAYIAASPAAYIGYYHLPAQFFGFLFGAGIIGMMAANVVNARLVHRYGVEAMLVTGNTGAAVAGLGLLVNGMTGYGGLLGLVVPMVFFVTMTGLIVANAVAGALGLRPDRSGTISALVGFVQYGSGVIGSALVGALADGTPRPMAIVVGACSLGGLTCALCLLMRPKSGAL